MQILRGRLGWEFFDRLRMSGGDGGLLKEMGMMHKGSRVAKDIQGEAGSNKKAKIEIATSLRSSQ
jgi:hypothetical protein